MSATSTAEPIRRAVDQLRTLIAGEGDEREFEEQGYHCLILRNPEAGYLSGYVGLPATHPFYGVECGDVDEIDVHGGLKFSGPKVGRGRERPGLWYLGFDCNHVDDLYPKDLMTLDPISLSLKRGASYKRMEYVDRELRRLAQQLKAAEHRRIYREVQAFDKDYTFHPGESPGTSLPYREPAQGGHR